MTNSKCIVNLSSSASILQYPHKFQGFEINFDTKIQQNHPKRHPNTSQI